VTYSNKMKRLILFSAIATLLGTASCKKSYTCKCVTYYYFDKGRTKPVPVTIDTIKAFRKKKVDPLCEKDAAEYVLRRNRLLDSVACYAFAYK
jgi:hypothetical protein